MRFTLSALGLAVLAPLALAATPQAAFAQSDVDVVWTQLQSVRELATDNGYGLRNYIVGLLDDGESDSWTFPLEAGSTYLITGVCDADCSDLDIEVRDENGTPIVEDATADDVPVVQFQVPSSGRYTVDVRMYSCSTSFCYFGLGIFND